MHPSAVAATLRHAMAAPDARLPGGSGRWSRDDVVTLRALVDAGTFERGRAYALGRKVVTCVWKAPGTVLIGSVLGSGQNTYTTVVKIHRSASGALVDFESECTCPVSFDCKHAVALLLASATGVLAEDRSAAGQRSKSSTDAAGRSTREPARPAWEQALSDVVTELPPEPEGAPSSLALQFELVDSVPTWGATARSPRSAGIRLRPVTPGRNGRWIRSGISWSTLDYYWYRGTSDAEAAPKLGLLKELLALSRVPNSRYSYRVNDDNVWLESIPSRRMWDLLAEATSLGMPLVGSPKGLERVALHTGPALAQLDVTRSDDGLSVRPSVVADDVDVPLDDSLMLGSPAHGLAWWTRGPGREAPDHLHLAPLASPLDESVRALIQGGTVLVPAADEARFSGEYHPLISERLRILSSDRSVDFPEPQPRHLLLAVEPVGRDEVFLVWSWVRAGGAAGRRGGLWTSQGRPEDRTAEADLVDVVTALVEPVPDMVDRTEIGARLASSTLLSGMAAVGFVIDTMSALEAVAGVELEVLGDLPRFRHAEGDPVVALGGTTSTVGGDWFDLSVTITVDGEDVPFRELFTALAEEQTHLILPSGTVFPLDTDELRQLSALIAEGRSLWEIPGGSIRVSRFQASWWEDVRALGVLNAQAAAWESSVRTLLEVGDRVDRPQPSGLHASLRPYQLDGFQWLAHLYENGLGGILADDMGLGKTVQALALVTHIKERQPGGPPVLVVAPTSVVPNWVSETERFAPDLEVVSIGETFARRGVPLAEVTAGADVVVTSYGLFRREFDAYEELGWAALFLDEAQFVKNHASQAHRRARMLSVPCKVAITGTPMENNLMELWSLFSIAAPGLLGSPERFGAYYRTPIERSGDAERLDQLRRRIRPLMLRRTKEQVASDLPAKLEQVLALELQPRHLKLYQAYLQRERQKVLGLLGDMDSNRFEIFRSLTLLRQASLAVSLIDEKHAKIPSTKLDVLVEMVDDVVSEGHRVLVFSQFTRFLRMAQARLTEAGVDHCYLDGRTRKRAEVIERFRTGNAPVFLISLKAGGFGLNLTEADYCILLDPWWNPATEAQAVDRTHRIGQTKKVMVYRLVAKDTIEEKVMAMKAKKAALFANVVDSGELASGALTADDIRGLLD